MYRLSHPSSKKISEVGANQIVFWLSVRIFNSLSRRFKQRCRTRAKEIKEKNIPLLWWDTSEIFFDLKMDGTNGMLVECTENS